MRNNVQVVVAQVDEGGAVGILVTTIMNVGLDVGGTTWLLWAVRQLWLKLISHCDDNSLSVV